MGIGPCPSASAKRLYCVTKLLPGSGGPTVGDDEALVETQLGFGLLPEPSQLLPPAHRNEVHVGTTTLTFLDMP